MTRSTSHRKSVAVGLAAYRAVFPPLATLTALIVTVWLPRYASITLSNAFFLFAYWGGFFGLITPFLPKDRFPLLDVRNERINRDVLLFENTDYKLVANVTEQASIT